MKPWYQFQAVREPMLSDDPADLLDWGNYTPAEAIKVAEKLSANEGVPVQVYQLIGETEASTVFRYKPVEKKNGKTE